jgi:hypothetical protein
MSLKTNWRENLNLGNFFMEVQNNPYRFLNLRHLYEVTTCLFGLKTVLWTLATLHVRGYTLPSLWRAGLSILWRARWHRFTEENSYIRGQSITTWTRWGGGGGCQKMSVSVHAEGIKTLHAGGGGVKKWQNYVHVVIECPLTLLVWPNLWSSKS